MPKPTAHRTDFLRALSFLSASVSIALPVLASPSMPIAANASVSPVRSDAASIAFEDGAFGGLTTKSQGTLHLTGEPAQTDVVALKAAGFVAIVDIRQASENRSPLESAARRANIAYHNAPLFDANRRIDANAVVAIGALHRRYGKSPHLVSCKSGNRSSAWYAAYLATTRSLTADQAIAVGRSAFLRDDMANAVKVFLNP
jgi:protein tyrosine phosphatase (PTP) superfamily phosphohydrolase (DUF442 family)